MKCNKNSVIHIGIIVVGTVFLLLSAFHTNMWFDESYSVAIANHSFAEIWTIGGHDVHPILYYWILHVFNLIFGSNLVVYRLFSILCIMLTGILGYTHIRKDFGERVGILFTYLCFFLPVVSIYAVEIRMYSLAMYLACVLGIYAYRIVRQEFSKKNWIIFAISSLCLSYTHYYGLMTAGIVNLILFIYVLRSKKDDKRYLKCFLVQAVIEVVLYVPWLAYFVIQVMSVGGGFWISLKFPDTLMEILNFQYNGVIGDPFSAKAIVALVFGICLYVYVISLIIRNKKEKSESLNAGIVSFLIYLGIIFIAYIISQRMAILYSRYIFVITGFLIFGLSYFLAKEKHVVITILILVMITGMSIYNEYNLVKENYSDNNLDAINYMKKEIKDDDIIIYYKVNMAVLNTYFPNNTQYFLNFGHWGVQEAYKAYAPSMKIVEDWSFLDDFQGRIWIVDSENDTHVYDNIDKSVVDILKEKRNFKADYHDYEYDITLVQKR